MKTINIPGFTAEMSLHFTGNHHTYHQLCRDSDHATSVLHNAVVPQLPRGDNWECWEAGGFSWCRVGNFVCTWEGNRLIRCERG